MGRLALIRLKPSSIRDEKKKPTNIEKKDNTIDLKGKEDYGNKKQEGPTGQLFTI